MPVSGRDRVGGDREGEVTTGGDGAVLDIIKFVEAEAVKEILRGSLCVDTEADKEYACGLIDELPGKYLVENEPEIVPIEVLIETCGDGWVEDWHEAIDDLPEGKDLLRCAWCCGHLVDENGDIYDRDSSVVKNYTKKYGLRVWTKWPTPERREAEPWED